MTRPMQSEQVNELAAALAAAQGQFASAKKTAKGKIDSDKASYEYTYADLAEVIEATKAPLSSAGLSITSAMMRDEEGPALRTKLLHTSGQWEASYWPMDCDFTRPWSVASCVSYGRRYNINSLLNVACEDDDGASAQAQAIDARRAVPNGPRNGQTRDERRPVARERYEDATPVNGRRAPDAADLAAQDEVLDGPPPSKLRRPAPTTGAQLYEYATTCKTDPDLTRWIERQFPRHPHRLKQWTDNQVVAAWAKIREHLVDMKAARKAATPVNGAAS